MKKIVKIFSLIIFIILILSIKFFVGAADYFTVGYDTSAKDILEALSEGKELKITTSVKEKNDNLICSNRFCPIWLDSTYTASGSSITLPGKQTNGYAKAYILAAPDYVTEDDEPGDVTWRDHRQYAWHHITGDGKSGENPNKLYRIAESYQEYKEDKEIETTVTKPTNEETVVDGENMVYGPININYSYGTHKEDDEVEDRWGGFYYAFFDEAGSNVNDKVKLCILEDGTYSEIKHYKVKTEGETFGYYQVRRSTYNNKKLYAVTSDLSIGNVSLKILDNKVDYSATIQKIEGKAWKESHYPLCTICQNKLDAATSNIESAISSAGVLNYGGNYYKYSETTTHTQYASKSSTKLKNIAMIGDTEVELKSEGTIVGYTGCAGCKKSTCSGGRNVTSSDDVDEYRSYSPNI